MARRALFALALLLTLLLVAQVASSPATPGPRAATEGGISR